MEDLSPELLSTIGYVFHVDPECFAEHLNRSGYNGVDYDDLEPDRWTGSRMAKRHTSITWFRPVRQHRRVTEWLGDPRSLLDKSKIQKKVQRTVLNTHTWSDPAYDSKGRLRPQAMDHRVQVETNVFRRSWSLSARPSNQGDFSRTSSALPQGGNTRTLQSTTDSDSDSDEYANTQRADAELVPTAWEERATFFPCTDFEVPIGVSYLSHTRSDFPL